MNFNDFLHLVIFNCRSLCGFENKQVVYPCVQESQIAIIWNLKSESGKTSRCRHFGFRVRRAVAARQLYEGSCSAELSKSNAGEISKCPNTNVKLDISPTVLAL